MDPTQADKTEQQFLEALREGQRAVVDAVGAWAKSVETMSAAYPPVPEPHEVPSPEQVVERAFDFAEKMLATQREFARNLLAAAAPAFPQPGGPGQKPEAEE